ncbi:tRNA pseudouridine(55) synthase TruB [Thermosulfurimonas sp. F29]|uniref:tRNA pseudouridine(55) synthase TruB n=1 Tax=Thermosulfurimonas sp. F29 TaxID=2867247 RepID=UPI001C8289B4|nr:tRNA pseudouridine(55) synthase TruB [Thermosulfurimonas sp. F29]MBX6422771.1 tRNA pseudouridine(55) synthase TruB [Thermosulfurimonas sp. F29]
MTVEGVLVLDKPRDMTSTEAVERLKRLLRVRKAGHGGTLDPFATGVLPVCLGRATKIAQFILEGDKRYEGVFELGIITDTYDLTGEVVERRPVPELSAEEVTRVMEEFVGILEQVPPPYSAAKYKGRPLYQWARKGVAVKKEPKQVEILEFRLKSFDPPRVFFEVYCSKGTYVRSLVHEVGLRLGCGATLVELRRTQKGPFRLEEALTLEEVEKLHAEGKLAERIRSVEEALSFIPAIVVSTEMARRLRQGRPLSLNVLGNLVRLQKVPRRPRVPWLRIVTEEGDLVAVTYYPERFSGDGWAEMLRVFVS